MKPKKIKSIVQHMFLPNDNEKPQPKPNVSIQSARQKLIDK